MDSEPIQVKSIDLGGVNVNLYRSKIDGTIVVDIEGDDEAHGDGMEPVLCVYLNDSTIHERRISSKSVSSPPKR